LVRALVVLFFGLVAEVIVIALFWVGPSSRVFGLFLLLSFVVIPFLTLWILSRIEAVTLASSSQNTSWSAGSLPPLTFAADSLRLEIAHLGGEDHRQAFAAIFARVILDNRSALEMFTLVNAEARRGIAGLQPLPVPMSAFFADPKALALTLYDSHNDVVVLKLTRAAERADFGVRFDEPEFWLESHR
jgi:hypothetical protein